MSSHLFCLFFRNKFFKKLSARFKLAFSQFSTNLAQIWRECCQIILHQNFVSEFYFLRSFKSNDPLKREKGCFLKLQSLTECRKQTRPDKKIPRHGFWDKGVKNSARCSSYSPDHFRVELNRFCERCTFEKYIDDNAVLSAVSYASLREQYSFCFQAHS